jgi:hypothetical protein
VSGIDVHPRTFEEIRRTRCCVLDSFVAAWSEDAEGGGRELIGRRPPIVTAATGSGLARARGWMCADWLIRVHAATWLDRAGDRDVAASLRQLPAIRERTALEPALAPIDDFRERAGTSWEAACAVAGADPEWEAEAALDWETARDSAWNSPWRGAWEAAHEAPLPDASDLLDAVLHAARHAARDAAFDVLRTRPEELSHVKLTLKLSSLELFDRMIWLGRGHRGTGEIATASDN